MIIVAVLLLPLLGLVLYGMDRLEDRMFGPPSEPAPVRRGHRRHLRLIGGTATAAHRHRRDDTASRPADAA